MNAKDYASQLLRSLHEAKGVGVESFATDYLIAYVKETVKELETLADEPTPADLERYKANLQGWLEEFKNVQTQNIEMFRSVITAGQNALRTSFLMNGGASLAILTFIGHLATNTPDKAPLIRSMALEIFVAGVLSVTCAAGVTYLSQWVYSEWFYARKGKRAGFVLNILAIVLGLASYVVFAWGACKASSVFATW